MRGRTLARGAAICATWTQLTSAISLDITSQASIKSAASTVAYGMMKYYTGNNTGDNPGNLPSPYYWWEAGATFGTMVEYWYYTNDTSYNPTVTAAILSQVGTDDDFMPTNQTKTEGNDDQGFWGMTAMSAAEMNYPNPSADEPQWLALAQAVFNEMVTRWDDSTCGGGLRWQIFTFNNGYTYKNSIANGCFFNLGARLARYTGNQTYADWAEKTWDWMESVGLMSDTYIVYDGTSDTTNCSTVDHLQFTYNQGIYLFGAAMMYNYTYADWAEKTWDWMESVGLMSDTYIVYDGTSDTTNCSTVDHLQFTYNQGIYLFGAAMMYNYAAAAQCDGGTDGTTCGEHWTDNSTYDGNYGLGQQMSALSVIQAMLIDEAPELVTNTTGGTSVGNANAGSGSTTSSTTGTVITPATGADKAGAGILTALVLSGVLGGIGFMVMGS
ncbi:probable mannan endo-1,6-alpha-mannosidase DCW1 precursor [Phialocephala subalpina]|uniref:Mannan endo-1,6-alpha-mannosidase n=1 Tax=Phialocephala subalpina TaxID=576137 RepID=A0A1L7XH92_9HELO|nr:probable mannan endo-1,6-alpha-mannosidase DCW1 precursor [Phialocephala subalpina]